MSKGSRNRVSDRKAFRNNHDRIFGQRRSRVELDEWKALRKHAEDQNDDFDALVAGAAAATEAAPEDLSNEDVADFVGAELQRS